MHIQKVHNDRFFDALRKTEYARLDEDHHVYLDYTGGNIFPKSLVEEHCALLQQSVFGNPHSDNPTSQLASDYLHMARDRVLEFFNARDYYCIFTANASAALQIVGECYPFGTDSALLLTADNHNSVNGIREYCTNRGAGFSYCGFNSADLTLDEEELDILLLTERKKDKLFAYPAQSNASGIQHSLSWVYRAQALGWDVLLDAAAFAPTSKLDLSEVSPEFVCMSFYKMFGYPTGIGCLLVRKSAFPKLKKPWFAGGTVSLVSVNGSQHFLLNGPARFESGTVNYLNMPAVIGGLNFIDSIGIYEISRRVKGLTSFLIEELLKLRHGNGAPVIKVYGSLDMKIHGGTIMMNFFDRDGLQYPYQDIQAAANEKCISVRGGCFCNPGVDEINSGVSARELRGYFETRQGADYHDMVSFLGKWRGAIRVSLGIPTTLGDLQSFISLASTFINSSVSTRFKKTEGPGVLVGFAAR